MHEGHRQRMLEKLERGDNLFDHEVLEILLYNVCPRVNTNPTAHALLERFCSLSAVLNAEVEELMTVKGVGENVARYLKIIGKCYERIGSTQGAAILKSAGDCKNFVTMRFKGRTEEFLELYFLEKNGCVKRIYSYTSCERNKAETGADEIIRNIALAKPYGIIAAHNHLNDSAKPSENDDIFTGKLYLICKINNIIFLDHLIYVGKSNIYSYKNDGAFENLKKDSNLDSILEWKKILN